MAINLLALESEKRFEEFCQALLGEEFPRFQAFSAPDLGMDGYDSDSETVFQAYFPERVPRKDKIRNDLEKAKRDAWPCKKWVLLVPKNPTPSLLRWLREEEQPKYPFALEVWGKTKIFRLLREHPKVREAYFPTELRKELRRLAKGKRPRPGDAQPGHEISQEQAAELHQLIVNIAEEEAKRKKRKPRGPDYQREFGEFNARFELSSYTRLPASKFLEARRYLEQKLYARRRAETQSEQRYRCLRGIKVIQKKLGIGEKRYRQILVELTGKGSTKDMDLQRIDKVFRHFQYLQGLAESQGNG